MNKPLLIATMMAGAALLLLWSTGEGAEEGDTAYNEPDLIDQADAFLQDFIDMTSTVPADQQAKNLRAFMQMIRVSEGTAGPDGYRTIVGGSLFSDYSDHPRVKIWIPSINDYSSAAGAFQIIRRTWDGVRAKLALPDFSPASQDAAAIELIRQRGGLADARAGRFAAAVEKCKKEWASLPGAGYGQRENSLARLQTAYLNAGGVLA